MILVHFQGKTYNVTLAQVYAPTTTAKEAEIEWFYEDLQDLLELTLKKKNLSFHHRGLECKSKKSRDTWQMKQGKGSQSFSRERTGHSKQSLPTTQEITLHMDILRWSIPKSD